MKGDMHNAFFSIWLFLLVIFSGCSTVDKTDMEKRKGKTVANPTKSTRVTITKSDGTKITGTLDEEGIWSVTYPGTSQKKQEGLLKRVRVNGKSTPQRHGKWTSWYRSGQKESEFLFKNDKNMESLPNGMKMEI